MFVSSTLLSLNCVSQWTFVSKVVKSSFLEEEKKRKKVKKKRTALFFKTFAKKRTALFEDFLLLRIVSTKSINLSLFRTENTQNTNTRSYYIRSLLTFKEFSFCCCCDRIV